MILPYLLLSVDELSMLFGRDVKLFDGFCSRLNMFTLKELRLARVVLVGVKLRLITVVAAPSRGINLPFVFCCEEQYPS